MERGAAGDKKYFVAFLLAILFLLMPGFADAQGTTIFDYGAAADQKCLADCLALEAIAKKSTPPKTEIMCFPVGKAKLPCGAAPPGGSVGGICIDKVGCKAENASGQNGGNALDQGLSKLGEMLGKLMEMMKNQDKGGGGEQNQNPMPNGTGSTCTTLQRVDTKSIAESNPNCYYYDPSGGTGKDPSGGLVAQPTSGKAPLTVYFAFTNGTTGCGTPVIDLDFADGQHEQQQIHVSSTCTASSETTKHIYTTPGQYAARLLNASTNAVIGGVNITVTEGDTSTTTTTTTTNTSTTSTSQSTNTGGTNENTGTNSNIGGTQFTTPLTNLNTGGTINNSNGTTNSNTGNQGATLNFNNPQSIVQSIIQKNLPPGAYGDVKIMDNGTTIIAGVREQNSEVAGFYGTNSTMGGTGAIAKMCQNRPWATNFLSFVIPASFFDSLCSWRGYTVGPKTITTPPVTGTTKTIPKTVKTNVGGTTKPATTTPATAPNAARVDITASPATVPLGARTSIFWNAEGVTDCIETSPDGSFSHNTLKGGASTVPLTSPTTFTISCVAPNGARISKSITVQISL